MPPVRLLHLFSIVTALCLMAAYGLFTARDREVSLRDAEGSLNEVTRLMEEHTRAALLAGALQLGRIEDMIDGRSMPELLGSRRDWRRLKRITAEVAHSDSAWIIGADANLVLSTLRPSGVRLNVADRAYFNAARDGIRDFISPMIWGKLYGGYYFAMSRRIENSDGSFKGVVQVSLHASYFSDFYKTLRPENGATFTIFKDDGSVVARHPLPPPATENVPPPEGLLSRLPTSDPGGFVDASPDGITRLYVYRRVAGHPLVVGAALPVDTVFAGWRERTRNSAVLAVAVLALLGLAVWRLTVTMRREEKGRARAEALLADKDVLFQEIHHRVKNNLQIIASFLTMQAIRAPSPATAEAFEEALSRIQSMGLVHQTLYEQHEASEVSMDAYLRALAASVGQSYGGEQRGITVEIATDGTHLPLDQAVPMALLANEALTNAFKHAFPDGRRGTIRIALVRCGKVLQFTLSDDGIGLAPAADPKAGTGLGMHILAALVTQLAANLKVDHGAGTCVSVTFPG